MKPSTRYAPIVLLSAVLLVIGTAGGAVAAKLITGKDVKDSSLTGKDIKNGSLGAKELSTSAKASLKGNAGAAGAPGISGYQVVGVASASIVDGGNSPVVRAYCPLGKKAIGGGASWSTLNASSVIANSGPFKANYLADGTPFSRSPATSTDASGWEANGRNNLGAPMSLFVFVTCANVS